MKKILMFRYICYSCLIEHCLDTNCYACERGKYPDCEWLETKKYYMNEEKTEED